VRIAGEKQQREPAAAGPAAGAAGAGAGSARRPGHRRQMWIILGVVAALLIGLNAYAAYVLTRTDNATAGANLRP
jgi:hypothetical protein